MPSWLHPPFSSINNAFLIEPRTVRLRILHYGRPGGERTGSCVSASLPSRCHHSFSTVEERPGVSSRLGPQPLSLSLYTHIHRYSLALAEEDKQEKSIY
jgi:hypothetical protein